MDSEPLANLIFNSRARAQFFDRATFVHIYADRDLILLHGYTTDKSPDSTPYELTRHRGRGVVAVLPPDRASMEIMRALFRAGLSEDRPFFRLAKAPGERGWVGIENLDRPPRRQEAIMRVTDFIEPPELRDFDMDEWNALLLSINSRKFQIPQVERLSSYVLSAHRLLQFEERRGTPSTRRATRVRRAEVVMEQFHENLLAIAAGVAGNQDATEKMDRLCVAVTGEPLPNPPPNNSDDPEPETVAAPRTVASGPVRDLPKDWAKEPEHVLPVDWTKKADVDITEVDTPDHIETDQENS